MGGTGTRWCAAPLSRGRRRVRLDRRRHELVYHTPGPGDPMFVRDAARRRDPNRSSPPLRASTAHFPVWSPDGAFIYFVQGTVPDRMDIWRVRPTGGAPERITIHDARRHLSRLPEPADVAYAASDRDGSGPWLHSRGRRATRAPAGERRRRSYHVARREPRRPPSRGERREPEGNALASACR